MDYRANAPTTAVRTYDTDGNLVSAVYTHGGEPITEQQFNEWLAAGWLKEEVVTVRYASTTDAIRQMHAQMRGSEIAQLRARLAQLKSLEEE